MPLAQLKIFPPSYASNTLAHPSYYIAGKLPYSAAKGVRPCGFHLFITKWRRACRCVCVCLCDVLLCSFKLQKLRPSPLLYLELSIQFLPPTDFQSVANIEMAYRHVGKEKWRGWCAVVSEVFLDCCCQLDFSSFHRPCWCLRGQQKKTEI